MEKKLLNRNEVPVELTWDLSLIYENEDALHADICKAKELADEIEKKYKGNLSSAKNIDDCLTMMRQLLEIETLISNYCELAG